MAYGPTGSGKTWTMVGSHSEKEKRGLIPRSIEELCNGLSDLQSNGWESSLKISIVELYNNKLRDLLNGEIITNAGREPEIVEITCKSNLVTAEEVLKLFRKSSEKRI